MKKIIFLICLSLLLTGCSTKTVCTKTTKSDVINYETKLKLTFNDNKVKAVKYQNTFNNEDEANSWCKLLKKQKNNNVIYKCNGKKITVEGYEKELNTMNQKEIINYFKQEGFTCK